MMIELDLDEDAEGEGESDHDQQPGDDEEEPAAGPDTRVSARLAVISCGVCDNIVSTLSVSVAHVYPVRTVSDPPWSWDCDCVTRFSYSLFFRTPYSRISEENLNFF